MTRPPILYSFRRCPYAMRARMAIAQSGMQVELREVVLREKPPEMIEASPKSTVPVLVLPDGEVLAESLDIMRWVLGLNDPDAWLDGIDDALISANDGPFKAALDRYKYPHRYDLADGLAYRNEGAEYLDALEKQLADQAFLCGNICGFTDIAIFPFIRQFAATDREWFDAQNLPHVHRWLADLCGSALFDSVMTRYPQWHAGDADIVFPRYNTVRPEPVEG